jgi:uncharacterized membrane protein YhaH (DUF805 family)
MENSANRSPVRTWINPLRLYDPRVPAGRLVFLWGLAGYPLLVMFVFLTAAIVIMEATIPSANVGDDIGIVTWIFMLVWVMATVAITRRRLLDLRMSQLWVWLAILPLANLPLFLYLLVKTRPVTSHQAA